MDIDRILMLNADDIDYDSLPDDVLKALAICEEPYIATYALGALYDRDKETAQPVIMSLLSDVEADEYLKSYAIKIASRESWLHEAISSAIAGQAEGRALTSLVEAVASTLRASEFLEQGIVAKIRNLINRSAELPYEQKQVLLLELSDGRG